MLRNRWVLVGLLGCASAAWGGAPDKPAARAVGSDGTPWTPPWSGLTRHTAFSPALGGTTLDVALLASAAGDVLDPPFVDPQTKLLQTGLFSSVTTIHAGLETPTLDDLKAFDAVLVWSNFDFADPVSLGDVLADYADASDGGGVVVAVFANTSDLVGRFLEGRWHADDYHVINTQSGNKTGSATLGTILDPGNLLMNGVTSFDGGISYRPLSAGLHAAAALVAEWSDGTPLVAARTDLTQARVDLGLYPPSSDALSFLWDAGTDGTALLANSLLFAADRTDVEVALVPVLTPSAVNTTTNLDGLAGLVPPGACPGVYYIEVWATDRGAINTGVTGLYVDIVFNPSVLQATGFSYSGLFPFFHEGTADNGVGIVSNFGASGFTAVGVAPGWARVGAVQFTVLTDVQTVLVSDLAIGGLGVFGRPPPSAAQIQFMPTLTPSVFYGDVDRDGSVTLSDILCVVDAFQGLPTACTLSDLDLAPCGGDGLITVDDILAVIDAFATGVLCCPS